jgi:RNA polymerase sigma-32 factor
MIESECNIALRGSFSKHVRVTQRYQMLSQEEQFKMCRHWRSAKNQAATEKLVTSQIRLAVRIASNFRGYGSQRPT